MAHSASGPSPSSQFVHNTDGQEQHDQIATVPKSPEPGLVLYMNFNQDQACFACGTENGFRIFNCDPFKETFRREFDGGSLLHPHLKGNPSPELDGSGIGIVEMLFMSNILALVGGGRNPRYSPNKVMIWDDHQSRCIGELLFRSEVRAVRLRRDRIVVVLEQKIYVYDFSNLKLLHQIETIANSRGLCAFSSATNACVLACPGLRGGEVRIELYTAKKTKLVQAHDSPLACLALSQSGNLLATASTKGTIIRIFNTADGTKLQELRRGADRADVYSMTFSPNCQWFVLSSGKGTIHVFSLRLPWSSAENVKSLDRSSSAPLGTKADASSGLGSGIFHAGSTLLSLANANTGSSLSFMKGVLPKYFSSEWSFAQFRLIENTRAIVAFGAQKNTIIIVCSNGSYYRCAFDPIQGGEMVQIEFARFLNSEVE